MRERRRAPQAGWLAITPEMGVVSWKVLKSTTNWPPFLMSTSQKRWFHRTSSPRNTIFAYTSCAHARKYN